MMRVLALAWLFYVGAQEAVAETGAWQGADEFAQANVACTRVYYCRPTQDIVHSADTRIASDRTLVWGVCSADGGPVDSCNTCLTSTPTTPCTWRLVPR
jgi:hypothetical protein